MNRSPRLLLPAAAAALAAALLLLAGCGPRQPAANGDGIPPKGVVQPASQEASAESDEGAGFRVSEAGPSGTVPHENLEGGAWVLFTRPVVALKRLDEPASSSPVLSIQPRVDGIFRWYGSRLLAFEPSAALAPATEYTLAVNPATKSLDGAPLTGDTRFTFKTEPLQLVAVSPQGDDVPPESCREIVLTFNHPVDLRTIAPSLRLEAGGRRVAFRAARPKLAGRPQLGTYENDERLVSLFPSSALPWNTDITVRVLEGARPRPGTYGTPSELASDFHTLRPLEVQWTDVYLGRPAPTAVVRFNHPVEAASARGAFRTSIPGYDASKNLDTWGTSVSLAGLPVPFESSFTLTVARGLRDIYGQRLAEQYEELIEVGSADSYVDMRQAGQRLLEAGFPPVVAVEYQNIDRGSYAAGRLQEPFGDDIPEPSSAIDVGSVPRNTRHFEAFDLARHLDAKGRGAAFLSWKFAGKFWGSDEPQEVSDSLVVQVTDLGASVHLASNRLLVEVASLATGAPVEGAAVSLAAGRREVVSGRTDAKGLAALAIPAGTLLRQFPTQEIAEQAEIRIEKAGDRLVLRPARMDFSEWNDLAPYGAEIPRPLTYLYTDRGIYRPGETVSFAGIDRDLTAGKLAAAAGRFRTELYSGSGGEKPLAAQEGATSPAGGFEGTFKLAKDLEPGDYYISFTRGSGKGPVTGYSWLRVANFRRVSYAVEIAIPEGRKLMGETLQARIAGKYLAGGSVSRGQWSWFWTRRETWYQPPGDALADYSFASVEKGWAEDLSAESGALSGDGTVTASQPLADGENGRVYEYEVVATIEDVDRQAVSRRAGGLVFPSECLLGAKITSGTGSDESVYFVQKGHAFALKVVSVDPEGRPASPKGDIRGRLIRESWKLVRERSIGGVVDTRYEREDVVEKRFALKPTPGAGTASVALTTGFAGSYALEVEARDAKGRPSLTRLSFYSTGSGEVVWQRSDERRIEIVPDKPSYRPGDKARLLLKSPVAKGSYLVLVERDGILEQRRLELSGSAPVIEVDIREEHVPMVYVFVSTSLPRTSPPAAGPDLPDFGKPRGWSGVAELAVDTASRRISLEMSASKASYLPGAAASVTVRASLDGRPLEGAEIALVAADRGVLDLIDYHIPDPMESFYSPSLYPDRVAHYDTRELLLDPVTWKVRDLPGGDEKGEAAAERGSASDYAVRSNFSPTAVFRTGLLTGKDGTVTVSFTLPDLLTRFRTTAVGMKADLFGRTEGEILVQNPLTVRAALPRKLRVGDSASAGVVVTNLAAERHAVTVAAAAEAGGPVRISGTAEKTVSLKPGETVEVPFEIGGWAEGEAKLTFTITSDLLKEKLVQALEVETGYVREAFTIVGKTSGTEREQLVVPSAFAGTPDEGLHLVLDSTIASALAGAVRYLEAYPFDCLEQRTSKLFAAVLFPELAGASPAKLAADMQALARFANPDGGFSFWDDPAPRRSSYYATLRVAHLLAVARARKLPVPKGIDIEAMLGYLSTGYDSPFNEDLRGYALYVLAVYGKKEKQKADALERQGDAIGVLGYGFLGLARHAMGDQRAAEAVLSRLKNFLRVGTRTVTLVATVNDRVLYGGEVQAKALLLMLYARVAPQSQLVLGLAGDLLASNATGYWQNTSNAGWVLQAFAEMVEQQGEKDADVTARVSLGKTLVAQRRFKGFSRAPDLSQVGAQELARIASAETAEKVPGGTLLPLTFSAEGRGSLYYTAMLRYSAPAAQVEPRDEGIGVTAEILDGQGRAADPAALASGKVYRMRLVVYSSRDRTFLAVRAPIPSGAEPIDGSLATSQVVRRPAAAEEEEEDEDWWGPGYTTRLYDNEVRFFFDLFARGKQELSFLFRTTTPGLFPTPPAQAECMYQGEVFGRTGGVVYRIGDRAGR